MLSLGQSRIVISFSSLRCLQHYVRSSPFQSRLHFHQRSNFLVLIRSNSSFHHPDSRVHNSVEFSSITILSAISAILYKDLLCRCGSSYRLQENAHTNSVRVSRLLRRRPCITSEDWAYQAHSKFNVKTARGRTLYLKRST